MIDGDPKKFIEGLHYGDERFFLYDGHKYFVQGYFNNKKPMLVMYIIEEDSDYEWRAFSDNMEYPVSAFENAAVFNGKTFWEVEQDITWVDC